MRRSVHFLFLKVQICLFLLVLSFSSSMRLGSSAPSLPRQSSQFSSSIGVQDQGDLEILATTDQDWYVEGALVQIYIFVISGNDLTVDGEVRILLYQQNTTKDLPVIIDTENQRYFAEFIINTTTGIQITVNRNGIIRTTWLEVVAHSREYLEAMVTAYLTTPYLKEEVNTILMYTRKAIEEYSTSLLLDLPSLTLEIEPEQYSSYGDAQAAKVVFDLSNLSLSSVYRAEFLVTYHSEQYRFPLQVGRYFISPVDFGYNGHLSGYLIDLESESYAEDRTWLRISYSYPLDQGMMPTPTNEIGDEPGYFTTYVPLDFSPYWLNGSASLEVKVLDEENNVEQSFYFTRDTAVATGKYLDTAYQAHIRLSLTESIFGTTDSLTISHDVWPYSVLLSDGSTILPPVDVWEGDVELSTRDLNQNSIVVGVRAEDETTAYMMSLRKRVDQSVIQVLGVSTENGLTQITVKVSLKSYPSLVFLDSLLVPLLYDSRFPAPSLPIVKEGNEQEISMAFLVPHAPSYGVLVRALDLETGNLIRFVSLIKEESASPLFGLPFSSSFLLFALLLVALCPRLARKEGR